MKCIILENLSTKTNMDSFYFLNLGKPKIKSIKISTQGSLGTSKVMDVYFLIKLESH
jgi:hypothetical protein